MNPLNTKIWQAIQAPRILITLKKKEYLFQALQSVEYLYFVHSGLLRIALNTDQGREYNKTFVPENFLYADMHSFWSEQPSPYFAQAIEPTQVSAVSMTQVVHQLESDRDFEHLIFLYLKERTMRHEQREIALHTQSNEARYLSMLSLAPDFITRIPSKHLASYLGMTEVSLSRIKRTLKSRH